MASQILLIEDSPTQALRLRLILERDGLKVTVARDGQEGLRISPLLLPDAVVLDVNLPDLNGFQVCQALKDHPATSGTPVIMLTVKDGAADALAGLDAGVDAYIPKDEFAEVNLRQVLRDMGVL